MVLTEPLPAVLSEPLTMVNTKPLTTVRRTVPALAPASKIETGDAASGPTRPVPTQKTEVCGWAD